MEDFDLVTYNPNFLSIKDGENIDIRDSKWNDLFISFDKFNFVYFYGERCLENIELINDTITKTIRIIDYLPDNFFILLELSKANLELYRNDLSIFWNYYELA